MKTNNNFYEAVDWVKTHGEDFWNQFDKQTWNAAVKYMDLIVDAGMSKSEAAKYVRTHF